MKERVFKTRDGVELFFDGNTFYSSNPNEIIKWLKIDSESEDEIAKIFSTEILSLIKVHGIHEKHNKSN